MNIIPLPQSWRPAEPTQLSDDERHKLYWKRKADRKRRQFARRIGSGGVLALATRGVNVVSVWFRWADPIPCRACNA